MLHCRHNDNKGRAPMTLLQKMLDYNNEDRAITPDMVDGLPLCSPECIHHCGKYCAVSSGPITRLCEPVIYRIFKGLSNRH